MRAATLAVVLMFVLSGCSLVPEGWRVALGSAIEVKAYFPNVAGLYVTNDVAVLGMPVGQVTEIEPRGERVLVTFTIDKDVPVPVTATPAIVNTSIVTTRHIELSPAYTEGDQVTDGMTLENEGKAPVSVGEMFDALDDLVNSLKSDQEGEGTIADMVDIASGITDGNGEAIREAITELADGADVVAGQGDAIVEIIRTVQNLTGTLVANYPQMTAFSRSVTDVAQMLDAQAPGLQATMADLNAALENTTEFLRNNSGTISSGTGRLAAVAANLSDYSRQVVDAINVAPLLFQNLSNSISPEQGAWRAGAFLDKSLFDNEMLAQFCQAINLDKDGCRTGQLQDFGPDLGVFSGLLELSKR